jgi:eukaryotic-like serine/threonine-protein kinase
MATPTDEPRPPRSPDGLATTLDLTPASQASTAPEASRPYQVPVVRAGGPNLSAETQTLLRERLRAATLLLSFGFGVFFVRNLILFETKDVFLMAFHATMVAIVVGSFALLSGRRPLASWHLRGIEVAVFGLSSVFFATVQYKMMIQRVTDGESALLVASVKSTVIFTYTLIIVYSMLIPNTWRRTASVVIPMALVPFVVILLLRTGHPEVVRASRHVATAEQVSENVLVLLLAVSLAIYGTYVINSLRRQVHEARQLGQYQLGERLGGGGMGEVFRAEHRLLKRPCALKLIRSDSAADPRALGRFEREVRTTARLTHPNTVEIYDYGRTEDGTFYYVMELLRGLSLSDLVARHGPLPPGRAIYLMRQACEALTEAHAAGLIHRDLKPANIFAAERGGKYDLVKLLDFGLVKPVEPDPGGVELSREGSISGSPLYMAPEQAAGDRGPEARSDLYALGAVTYFLLTGRPPFEANTVMKVIIAHARDPVVPPSRLRHGVPADLEHVVLRCLAKDPAQRYPSAEALEDAFAGCAAAGDWDARRAAEWWHAIERGDAPPASGAGGPAATTQSIDRNPGPA